MSSEGRVREPEWAAANAWLWLVVCGALAVVALWLSASDLRDREVAREALRVGATQSLVAVEVYVDDERSKGGGWHEVDEVRVRLSEGGSWRDLDAVANADVLSEEDVEYRTDDNHDPEIGFALGAGLVLVGALGAAVSPVLGRWASRPAGPQYPGNTRAERRAARDRALLEARQARKTGRKAQRSRLIRRG